MDAEFSEVPMVSVVSVVSEVSVARSKMSEKCRIKYELRGRGSLHLHECADVSAFFESGATVKAFV